ncbi:MAG: TetR/AcrR family transcriptional regulator C-terminal domain-containing protein [Rhizobiaceae bacterium]|nr:TetR/AcrR family transcriptional regulator C-terminal domain-containing protein [Rhizobiaceae bacterium]
MSQAEKPKKHRSLNADKIVSRAMELADGDGFEALSMRKLASSLGVTAMSLYNHVAGKDDLLHLMLNRVVAEFESPVVGGEWQEMMRRRAHSMRRALLRHRWASTLLISEITIGEEIMCDINATVGCLVRAGFTYAQADWARNAIDSHVYGYTMQELNFPVEPEEYKAAAAQYLPMIPKTDYPFMHEATVQIIEGKYDGMTQFYFGLELILNGLKP